MLNSIKDYLKLYQGLYQIISRPKANFKMAAPSEGK